MILEIKINGDVKGTSLDKHLLYQCAMNDVNPTFPGTKQGKDGRTYVLTDISDSPTVLVQVKKDRIKAVRARLKADILDDYDPVELALIALFQDDNPAQATAARTKTGPALQSARNKIAAIKAATTYAEVIAVEV